MYDLSPIFDGPHYAVIFTSRSHETGRERYAETAAAMEEFATEQPGYLGIDNARSPGGQGVAVSYWRDLEAVRALRADAREKVASKHGRDTFEEMFSLRIALVHEGRWWPLHE